MPPPIIASGSVPVLGPEFFSVKAAADYIRSKDPSTHPIIAVRIGYRHYSVNTTPGSERVTRSNPGTRYCLSRLRSFFDCRESTSMRLHKAYMSRPCLTEIKRNALFYASVGLEDSVDLENSVDSRIVLQSTPL